MQFRTQAARRISIDMTPMIDVVFQLMIFFMLTLKIVTLEGDLAINMPLNVDSDIGCGIPDIKVRLIANPDGTLASLYLGRRDLGNDDRAYAALNSEVLQIIGRPGNPLTMDIGVELDPDYALNYQEVVKALGACAGRVDPHTKQVIRYLENVRFAKPRKPQST